MHGFLGEDESVPIVVKHLAGLTATVVYEKYAMGLRSPIFADVVRDHDLLQIILPDREGLFPGQHKCNENVNRMVPEFLHLRSNEDVWLTRQRPLSAHRHPPGDGASQWIQHDAEQPDRHPPGSACSGSDAIDRTGLGIRCWWSLDHPHNSNPKPANAAARLKQELAATSAAGALDADASGPVATAA